MSVRKRKWTTAKGEEREAWIVDYADQQGVRRIKTFRRKREADAWANATGVAVQEGTHVPDSATVTLAEAADLWIRTGEAAELERSTLDQYRQHVDLHIVPFLGRTKLSQLTVPMVRTFQERLRAGDPTAAETDPLRAERSAAMVKRVTGSLGSILADAQDRGLVARNVVREMARRQPRGKQRQGERRKKRKLVVGEEIPTRDEIKRLVEHVGERWRPVILTAIFTGLRASELRGLQWSDVELDAKQLHVRQRADRYNEIGPPKSEAGQRTVPLPPIVANTLRELKVKSGGKGLVFGNGKGNPESHGNLINRALIPALIKAGVTEPVLDEEGRPTLDDKGKPVVRAKYTGLHALRHFYASWLINRPKDGGLGLPPKMVQERLGHSSITMTMDTYGHLFPRGDDAEELAAAERALLG